MKENRISPGNNELRILREKFNIDLTEPASLKAFKQSSLEILKRVRESDRKIINSLYSNRKNVAIKSQNLIYVTNVLESSKVLRMSKCVITKACSRIIVSPWMRNVARLFKPVSRYGS